MSGVLELDFFSDVLCIWAWIAERRNSGRQMLYGNVGYRVLQANVEELLKRPAHEASWC